MTRRALRRSDVVALYGVPLRTLDRILRAEQSPIRTRRVGRILLLNPDDVERLFGFPSDSADVEVSAESVAEIEDLLA